jgi:hypothetical protein
VRQCASDPVFIGYSTMKQQVSCTCGGSSLINIRHMFVNGLHTGLNYKMTGLLHAANVLSYPIFAIGPSSVSSIKVFSENFVF